MKPRKKTRQSMAVERMTEDQRFNYLRTLYESAMRTGSIRAVEDRHRIGRNRLYRFCEKHGFRVPMPQMGPKKGPRNGR